MKNPFSFLDRPLIRQADALRDQGRWADAVIVYRHILSRSPHRAGAWVQLGHCLQKLGRAGQALDAYQSADRQRPDHADTLFHIAGVLAKLGRNDEAQAQLQRVIALAPGWGLPLHAARLAMPHASEKPEWFDHIVLGTTGTCNASCVHCPTGKASTALSPRSPMPMPLFRKIIDEIADSNMIIAGQISFGLFGDGFADPFVVERARHLRERLPHACLSVNTNGAAYSPERHAELAAYATVIALHCESLIPDTYDYLMQPLRLERVRAKYPLIFRDFPGKVAISAPMSRLNADERPALMDYFYKLGAINVDFPPLSNRLDSDETLFERISFAPVPIRCDPSIFYNLIVDCDGMVLACCNDFSRLEPVGDLSIDSVADTLADTRRMAFREKIAGGCHADIQTCSRCRGDLAGSIPPIDHNLQPTA